MYCGLNGVCYSEHYVEDPAKQMGSENADVNGVCYSEHYVECTAQQVHRGTAA